MQKFHGLKILKSQSLKAKFLLRHNAMMPVYHSQTSLIVQWVKNLPEMQETWVQSLGWDNPLEMEMAAHSRIFTRDSHGQRT